MTRTADVIQAEIDAAKAAGEHQASAKMRRLRAELKEVIPSAAVAGETIPEPEPMSVTLPDSVSGTCTVTILSPLDSDEWRFIEKCCAEVVDVEGIHQAKKVYNLLSAKLKTWRRAREIVLKFGIGARWPQWSELNLNPDTGEPVAPKPVSVPAPVAPAPTDLHAPRTVEQAMAGAAGADDSKEFARAVAAEIAASIGSRTEPTRKPEPAGASA